VTTDVSSMFVAAVRLYLDRHAILDRPTGQSTVIGEKDADGRKRDVELLAEIADSGHADRALWTATKLTASALMRLNDTIPGGGDELLAAFGLDLAHYLTTRPGRQEATP
jgi:hypothetical protein